MWALWVAASLALRVTSCAPFDIELPRLLFETLMNCHHVFQVVAFLIGADFAANIFEARTQQTSIKFLFALFTNSLLWSLREMHFAFPAELFEGYFIFSFFNSCLSSLPVSSDSSPIFLELVLISLPNFLNSLLRSSIQILNLNSALPF